MSKIMSDSHGLFVRGGGYVWRPVYPKFTEQHSTKFNIDDVVSVNHRGGPSARITNKTNKESWYSHGCYINNQGKSDMNSENFYKPSYENW